MSGLMYTYQGPLIPGNTPVDPGDNGLYLKLMMLE